MATPQLSELLNVPSQDDVLNQEVLPELVKRKVRLTDWLTGGVYRTFAYVAALLRVNARLAIATITAANFEDYVFGVSAPPANADGTIPDVTGYAPYVAKQRYGTDQILATYTRRYITLGNSTATVYGPIQPGQSLMIQFPSGNKYVLDQVVTIPASNIITALFRSEFPAGTYASDPTGSTMQLVTTQYAGVSAFNLYTNYSAVSQSGTSIGLVTPTGIPTGWPGIPHSVAVRIKTQGNTGVATWESNLDNGGWVSQGAAASALLGFNITVTLSDNTGNPAFQAGSVYYFSTPGSDIVQAGAPAETAQALGIRCRGLLPSLGFAKDGFGNWIPVSPTAAAYATLALSANTSVKIVFTSTDTIVNNRVNLIIAGSGGAPLTTAIVANVQNFFSYFSMLTDQILVATSTARVITLAGLTIFCKQAQLATAQATMTLRIAAYLGGVDAAVALGINGRIDYDYLIALIRTTPGITQVSGTMTVNAAAADLQLPVTPLAFEAATWSQPITSAFGWSAVA